MQAIATLLSLSLAAPPGAARIGVVWHEHTTVARDVEQRLLEALASEAAVPADAIVPDAVARARVEVAHAIPRPRAQRSEAFEADLAQAARSYRSGALADAIASLDAIEAEMKSDPLLPGGSSIVWRVHMLRAQIEWTRGDDPAMRAALRAAIAIDPDARPSTRRVPPTIVQRHAELRERALADRSQWAAFDVRAADPSATFQIEIDGRPGGGLVAPGEHFVVVRRPGHAPLGWHAPAGAAIEVPADAPLIDEGPPRDRESAQRICDAVGLSRLVFVRVRDDRIGLQPFACGRGFGDAWYSAPGDDPRSGVAIVLAAEADERIAARLHDDAPWPAAATQPADVVAGSIDRPASKPWFRRWWVWTLIGGAVAAGVTTGIVLGTRRPEPAIDIDADTFRR